jgi:hypothetical protein
MPKKTAQTPKVTLHKVSHNGSEHYFRSLADATRMANLLQKSVQVSTHWLADDPDFPDAEKYDFYEYVDPDETEVETTIKTNIKIDKKKRTPPARKGLPAPRLGLPAPE